MREDLHSPLSRRSTLALGASLLAGGIAAAQLGSAAGQEATRDLASLDAVEFLFAQSYAVSSLEPDPADATRWILTLSSGSGRTIYFSDRPNRIAGTSPTERFVADLGEGFSDDPANAALVAQVDPGTEVSHVAELLEMSDDAETGTATYTVRFLADPSELQFELQEPPGQAPAEAAAYGQTELFIDGGGLMQRRRR